MCAALHQYRPVAANEGGHIRSVFTPEKEPLGRLMVDSRASNPPKKKPHKLVSACRASLSNEAGGGIRTPDLLITNQLLYQLSYASAGSKPISQRPIVQSNTPIAPATSTKTAQSLTGPDL